MGLSARLSWSGFVGWVSGVLDVLRLVTALVLSVVFVWSLYKALVLAMGVNGSALRHAKKVKKARLP